MPSAAVWARTLRLLETPTAVVRAVVTVRLEKLQVQAPGVSNIMAYPPSVFASDAGEILSAMKAKQLAAQLRAMRALNNSNAQLNCQRDVSIRPIGGEVVASLNISNGYVPLLFVDNLGDVTALASRDGSPLKTAPLELLLVRSASGASVAWHMRQWGVDMLRYSWAKHSCGSPSARCLDGCHGDGVVLSIFNTKQPGAYSSPPAMPSHHISRKMRIASASAAQSTIHVYSRPVLS